MHDGRSVFAQSLKAVNQEVFDNNSKPDSVLLIMVGIKHIATAFLLILMVFSCSNDKEAQDVEEPDGRSFFMGFTAFPYDSSTNALTETYQNVIADGDIFLSHLDFGVPWDEAMNDLPFPEEVQNTINIAKNSKSSSTKIVLITTPTDQSRNNLAKYWNNTGSHQPLPAFWEGKSFDDPDVVSTFIKYCKRLIDEVDPDYFGYGIETNATFRKDDPAFAQFLTLVEAVYTALKADYPNLPMFLSLQDQSYDNTKTELLEISKMLVAHSDYIAMSTYPFLYYENLKRDANPDLFADNWLDDFRNLDTSKPFAVSETGFSADDLVIENLGVNAKSTEDWQKGYVEKLMNHLNALDAEFALWFVYRDYDLLYQNTPSPPDILKVWRDNGLLDGEGNQRPAYELWKQWLQLPKN
ncbi:Glycosyl hydrolase family 53 [Flagellimonas pacifica]|uniref:Glycosyl hydrolase family 53 n=2 Tax=Flagellimonas pacifica TaxID=1247520 RepID=A0A285MWY6_9FLAO|nr:Glycosyl hydrolase family 53 [Allomuricauda parva]